MQGGAQVEASAILVIVVSSTKPCRLVRSSKYFVFNHRPGGATQACRRRAAAGRAAGCLRECCCYQQGLPANAGSPLR